MTNQQTEPVVIMFQTANLIRWTDIQTHLGKWQGSGPAVSGVKVVHQHHLGGMLWLTAKPGRQFGMGLLGDLHGSVGNILQTGGVIDNKMLALQRKPMLALVLPAHGFSSYRAAD